MLAAAHHPFLLFGAMLLIIGIRRIVRPREVQPKTLWPRNLNPPRGTIRVQAPEAQPGHEGRVRVLGALAAAAGLALLIVGIAKLG